jgi:hypothetical protein
MNKFIKLLGIIGAFLTFGYLMIGCGMNGASRAPSFASDTQVGSPPLGGFNLNCKGGMQQQQSSYQQQDNCGKSYGQATQSFEFVESKVSDFDLKLDCDNRYVSAQTKGQTSQQAYFPIEQDGSVKGKMNYQQQMQSDGKGNQQCYVELEVDFDGKANCGRQESPEQQQQQLSLNTKVNFKQSQAQDISSDDPLASVVDASAVPNPYPGPVPNPYPRTGDDNGYGNSNSNDRGGASEPTPRVVRKKVCVVENPCPIVSKTNMSCPSSGGFEAP